MVLLARFILAAVFGLAGIAKLTDPEGVRRSLGQFGIPVRLVAPFAGALVLSELSVALGLLFGPFARASALAAVVLLAGFSAGVAVNLIRGRRSDCHCFGRVHSAPIAWSAVARNALLAGIALFVVAKGRFPWIFAVLGVVAVVVWLAQRLGRPRELGPGAVAPRFSVLDHEGVAWTLERLLAQGEPLVLVFSSPGCGTCRDLLPDIARWQRDLAGRVTVAVVSGGSRKACVVEAPKHGLRLFLVDPTRAVATAYEVTSTPSAILVDGEHRIAAAPALGAEDITDLIMRVATPVERPPLARRTVLERAVTAAYAATILPIIAAARGTSRRSAHLVGGQSPGAGIQGLRNRYEADR